MAELLQRRQPTLHQPPGAHADQDQQHRQGAEGGAQVGTEQGLVIPAVQRQQHPYALAAGQAHQAGGTEYLVAVLVLPVEVTEGFPRGEVGQQRFLGFGADTEQHRVIGCGADDGQVEIVMAHHQVQQRVGAGFDCVGVQAQR